MKRGGKYETIGNGDIEKRQRRKIYEMEQKKRNCNEKRKVKKRRKT